MTPDDNRSQRAVPAPQSPPAGWYADPQGPGLRWWDGGQWTEHVHAAPPVVPVTTTDVDRDRAGIFGGGTLIALAAGFFAVAIGIGAVGGGNSAGLLAAFWVAVGGGIACAVAAFGRSANTDSRLSAEARAVRIVVVLIVGAALVYGATQLADSTNKQTQQFDREFGY